MPDEEIPRYQVIYVSKGVGIVERTLESNLIIPLEPNASHVNAIVRTLMPSDAGRDERHKGLNECQFHLNLTDKPVYNNTMLFTHFRYPCTGRH
ncbi:unnamed protein product [Hymenolepis diminuta]|uniref:Uncharacterized protein n=1 Tax=Hymenolepis diminuta TaxID=6216 RepID=A0A564YSB7_HYMDI|nr:unnamed protein product [Hymenolepis diminuta]